MRIGPGGAIDARRIDRDADRERHSGNELTALFDGRRQLTHPANHSRLVHELHGSAQRARISMNAGDDGLIGPGEKRVVAEPPFDGLAERRFFGAAFRAGVALIGEPHRRRRERRRRDEHSCTRGEPEARESARSGSLVQSSPISLRMTPSGRRVPDVAVRSRTGDGSRALGRPRSTRRGRKS
jgi:hypothetical protein